jgi:PAS domain S-box-containing protein
MFSSGIKLLKEKSNLKLLLTVFVLLMFFTGLYIFLILPALRAEIYREKKQQTAEMIDIGLSVLDYHQNLEEQGSHSRLEAQTAAAQVIRALKYGNRDMDYFWINDLDAFMVVHPFRPDLEGKSLSDSDDPDDNYLLGLFQRFIEVCLNDGSGHITYDWQYYDEVNRSEEKLSYVALFEPWDWIIGTGVYLIDLEATIVRRRNVALGLLALFFTITTALTLFYFKEKQIEHKLLESEEKFRLIAENTADTITVLDLDLKYLYLSPSVYNLKGFTPEELMVQPLEHSMTPESQRIVGEILQREMSMLHEEDFNPDKTMQLELEEYRKDGSTIWVENSLSFIKDSSGKAIGVLSVAKDISERKKQQEALHKEQREKNLILDNMAELVSYLDLEMRIIWTNHAVNKFYQAEPEELRGHKCYEIWLGYDEPCDDCPVVKALESGQLSENVISYDEGQSWKMSASPVYDENGNMVGVLETALDVTDLKKAEEKLKSLNENLEQRVQERTAELEQANKELAAFTYSVSHDLRAPLRSIEGFSDAVLEDCSSDLDYKAIDYLERVRLAARSMNDLIDDLLKLSRVTRQELNRDQVDLSAMVTAYLKHLREKEPQRNVQCLVAPQLTATGDAALLRIALENLLDNAWKFTAVSEPARIEFGASVNDGNHVYHICDNGSGFDKTQSGKIFQAFQRLHSDKDFPGSGIGLSIVQRIIERHGGKIWAEAEPGNGATFFFTLSG